MMTIAVRATWIDPLATAPLWASAFNKQASDLSEACLVRHQVRSEH